MKSSTSTAIALTLLMFLLVLAAAVVLQGLRSRELDLISANATATRTFGTLQSEIELNNSAVQATLKALEASGTSTADENLGLTEQLANSDLLSATLAANGEQLTSDLDNANATVESYDSQAPLVTLVEPQTNAIVTVGQPVELVIVASDSVGVKSILFNIGSDPPGGPVEDAGVTAVKRHSWTPTDEGPITISITATNDNGIISEPYTIALTVFAAATSTPEPTAEPTLEPTPEN